MLEKASPQDLREAYLVLRLQGWSITQASHVLGRNFGWGYSVEFSEGLRQVLPEQVTD